MTPFNRIKSKKLTAHGFGRDALFKSERMRKKYLQNYQHRGELALFRERTVLKQKQAEALNELNRFESFINHMILPVRNNYMAQQRDKLRGELGRLAVALENRRCKMALAMRRKPRFEGAFKEISQQETVKLPNREAIDVWLSLIHI